MISLEEVYVYTWKKSNVILARMRPRMTVTASKMGTLNMEECPGHFVVIPVTQVKVNKTK